VSGEGGVVSSGRGMLCGAGGDLKQSGMSESLPELLEEDVDIYYRFIVFGEFLANFAFTD